MSQKQKSPHRAHDLNHTPDGGYTGFSLSFSLSVTHTPQLDQPEQFFTLLPLFLGQGHALPVLGLELVHILEPILIFELLPRVAHTPAADLPFLIQEHHRPIRVRPAEAKETAQVPTASRGGQRHTEVRLVLHRITLDHSALDECRVDSLLEVQIIRCRSQLLLGDLDVTAPGTAALASDGFALNVPKQAALHVQTVDIHLHPSEVRLRQCLEAADKEVKVLSGNSSRALLQL